MKYTLVEKLDSLVVSKIIERAWELEARRDIEGAIENFAPVWNDLEVDPDFSEFEVRPQADLYRLSGFFLSIYGSARNIKNYQERAKNLISRSARIFENLDNKFGFGDAQNVLAVCYINEGALSEAEAILEQTRELLSDNYLHPVYLRNRINSLQIKHKIKQYPEALEIINEIQVPIEFCEDFRTCTLFHEKAGIVYRGLQQYDQAVFHYNEAIKFATEIRNFSFVATERNNLAFLFNQTKEFDLAHTNIDEAIRLAKELNLTGWLPIYLDTQALIFASEGYFQLALEKIDEAILLYQNGDDYYGLTESIWNKCKFLLALERKEEAITLFGERLIPIASQQMGEFAVKGFVKEFSEMIHIKRNGTFEEEIQRFKRVEIVTAIRDAKYSLYDAADLLKIEPSQMIKMIDKEFPELYQELDILQLSELNDHLGKNGTQQLSAPRNISEIDLKETEITFENEAPGIYKTFYFSAQKMFESFGISEDGVVTIMPIQKITGNDFVLVEDAARNIYSFGKVNYDKALDLYFFVSEDEPMPLSFDEVTVIGKAVAYCPIVETDSNKVFFRQL